MTKRLFSEFPEVSSKQWKQKIQVDLKGADYNDTLIWNTTEGIDVKPFYHADETGDIHQVTKSNSGWKIGQHIVVENTKDANTKAIDAINRGAEAITFIITDESSDFKALIEGINSESIPVHFETTFITEGITPDIIHRLAKTGNWFKDLKSDHEALQNSVKNNKELLVDSTLYQNAGATVVQQLAYSLAHANEYLNHLVDDAQGLKATFKVSVGTNYFFEVAKLRALRLLWESLAKEYLANSECYIIASPSKRNKTIYDYNTNMLRTTTECMSAILGGANEVYNLPYDAIYHNSNEFGDRISRNQLLVLKHESYFDKVENAADGAYYIESLTEQLATKALALFKDIEANDGFLTQLKAGTIQRKIKESAREEQSQFDNGTLVLLGTNKHPNVNDKMKHDLELNPFISKHKRKTLIEPIIEKRLAEAMEQERLNDE